jgi:hypothetical protein
VDRAAERVREDEIAVRVGRSGEVALERASLGMLRFRCDGCGRITEVPRPAGRWASDDRAIEQAEWTPVQVEGVWKHYCPECAKSRER